MSSILQVEGGHPLRGEITVRGASLSQGDGCVAALADTVSELLPMLPIRDTSDVVLDLPLSLARRPDRLDQGSRHAARILRTSRSPAVD